MGTLDTVLQMRQRQNEQTNRSIEDGIGIIGNEVMRQEGLNRQEAELNRPVAQPVSDFLNMMHEKVRAGKVPGKLGATLVKLVQAGQMDPSQALAQADGLSGGTPAPQQGMNPLTSGVSPINGGKPINTSVPVREPQMGMDGSFRIPPAAPPPTTSAISAYGRTGTPANMYPEASNMQPVAPQVDAVSTPPPPPTNTRISQTTPALPPPQGAHQWSVRDVNDLRAAGGFPQERGKSEMDYMMELIKEQGRGNRNTENVTSKEGIAGDKVAADKQKLDATVKNWDANRQQAWAIAMSKLDALHAIASGKGGTKRDETLLKDARAAINRLRNDDTNLRVSLGALAQDPSVMQQITDNQELITAAEERLVEAEERVKSRLGETTGSSTETTKTPGASPAASPDAFLKALRGQ